MGIVVSLPVIGGIVLGGALGWILMIKRELDLGALCPEAKDYIWARKKYLPLLELTEPGSGKVVRTIRGSPSKEGKITFEDKQLGLYFDPSVCEFAVPERRGKGLEVFKYSTRQVFPISERTARAYKTIFHVIRRRFKKLDFLPDDEVTTLLQTPRDDLEHDTSVILDQYTDGDSSVDLTPNELKEEIIQAQDECAEEPVELGWYAYSAAFQRSSEAYSSKNLQEHEVVCTLIGRKQGSDGAWKNLMPIVVAIVAIIIGGAVAYNMIG